MVLGGWGREVAVVGGGVGEWQVEMLAARLSRVGRR